MALLEIGAMDWNWVITIVVAILAAAPGLYAVYRQQRKIDAEATQTIGKAYKELFDELDERIKVLEAQLIEKQRQIEDLESEIDDLRTLMRERGIEPPPRRRPRK